MGKPLSSEFFNNTGAVGSPTNPNTGDGLAQMRSNQKALLDLAGFASRQTVGILDGAIIPTGAYIYVDTEEQTPTDDLTVINPIRSEDDTIHDGFILYLQNVDDSRKVIVKNDTGLNSIKTLSGQDVTLNKNYWLKLQYSNQIWEEISELDINEKIATGQELKEKNPEVLANKLITALQFLNSGGFSNGMIINFRGSFGGSDGKRVLRKDGSADENWVLCDGTNGTPNLVNRFIRGGNGANQNTTGGSDTHNHSGSVASHVLTTAQMPSHNHAGGLFGDPNLIGGGHAELVSNSGNIHKYSANINYTGSNHGHSHGLTINSASNLPSYYTLAYVMYIGE